MSDSGKGDRPRPCDKEKFDENFGKKETRTWLTNEEIMKKYPDGAYGPGYFCPYNPFSSGSTIGVDMASGSDHSWTGHPQEDIDFVRERIMVGLGLPAHLLESTGSAHLAEIARNNPNFRATVEDAIRDTGY